MDHNYFNFRRTSDRQSPKKRTSSSPPRRSPTVLDQKVGIASGNNTGRLILGLILLVGGLIYLPEIIRFIKSEHDEVNGLGEVINPE